MSDFFGGLNAGGGIRRPDVVMNDGPLPPMSISAGGYPAGFNGTPDGRIDYASSLLGNVSPYAYGEADRLSTQTAYLNIPHRVQRIVPTLSLPEAQPWDSGGSFFRLSHQVDDGDIAFVIRAMFSPYELVEEKKKYNRQGILYAVDPVVNLATVNYILHGLQRFGYDKKNVSWHTLWQALGIDHHFVKICENKKLSDEMLNLEKELQDNKGDGNKQLWAMCLIRKFRRMLSDHIVKNVIRPFGVPTGSERQGGQHQGSNSAITWPVDFVTTLTIDGLVINLVNFWRHEDVNSGDDLMLYVEERNYTEYVLSHHHKNMRKQVFPSLRKWDTLRILDTLRTDDGKKKRQRTNHSDNAAAMFLDRMWDFAVSSYNPFDKKKSVFDHVKEICNGLTNPVLESIFKEIFEDATGLDKFNIVIDSSKEPVFQLVPGICNSASCGVRNAVWRHGYWHIARSQIMHFKYDQHLDIPNGYHAAVRGKVLQATFAPVWTEPLEDAGMFGGPGATVGSTFAVDTQDRHCAPSSKRQRLVGVVATVVGGGGGIVGGGGGGSGGGGSSSMHMLARFSGSGVSGRRTTRRLTASISQVDAFKVGEIDRLTMINDETRKAVKSAVNGVPDKTIAPETVIDTMTTALNDDGTSWVEIDKDVLFPTLMTYVTENSSLFSALNIVKDPLGLIFSNTSATVVRELVEAIEDTSMLGRLKTRITGRKKYEEGVPLILEFSMPSMVTTIVRMVHGDDAKVPVVFDKSFGFSDACNTAAYTADEAGYKILSKQRDGLLATVTSACALLIAEGRGIVKAREEMKMCMTKGAASEKMSTSVQNLRLMMRAAAFEKNVEKDKVTWCLLGAYIGACVGLGATSGDDILIGDELAGYRRDADTDADKTRRQIIAGASHWMIYIGMQAALKWWEKRFVDPVAAKFAGDEYNIVKKELVKTILLSFVNTCFLVYMNIENGMGLMDERPVSDKLRADIFEFLDSECNWSFPLDGKFANLLYVKNPDKEGVKLTNGRSYVDIDTYLRGKKTLDPFNMAGEITNLLEFAVKPAPEKWARDTVKDFNADPLMSTMKFDQKEHLAYYKYILEDFSYRYGDFAECMQKADPAAETLKKMLIAKAMTEDVVERFVGSKIEGFHVNHYYRALNACMKEAQPLLFDGWKEFGKVMQILNVDDKENTLTNLLVAPAMILAATRMVHGREAKDTMTEEEKQYNLLASLNTELDPLANITPAQCSSISCALACEFERLPAAQGLLVKAALAGDWKDDDSVFSTASEQLKRKKDEFKNFFLANFVAGNSTTGEKLLCHMMIDHACAMHTWTMHSTIIDKITDSDLAGNVTKALYRAATVIISTVRGKTDLNVATLLETADIIRNNINIESAKSLVKTFAEELKKAITDDARKKQLDALVSQTCKKISGGAFKDALVSFIEALASIIPSDLVISNEISDGSGCGDLIHLSGPISTVTSAGVGKSSSSKLKKVSAKLLS
jgi:hypothetical protein